MPYDYTNKGWPASLTLSGQVYSVGSCDKDDSGLVYTLAAAKNPHVTIHDLNKEGPGYWKRTNGFHVRVSGTKLYEYTSSGEPDNFVAPKGKKGAPAAGTGLGTIEQTTLANAIATDFAAAIAKAILGD